MVEHTPQECVNDISSASNVPSSAEADLNAELLSIDPGKLLALLLASMTAEDKARTVTAARAQGLLRTRESDTQTDLAAGRPAQPANCGSGPTVHPLVQAQRTVRRLQAAVTGLDPSRAGVQESGPAAPNGPLGTPGGPTMGEQQMAHPDFSTLGQQSQPNSPAAQGLPAQSPSMGNRQVRPPQEAMRQLQEAAVNADLLKIESAKLPVLKAELGLADKDLPALTLDDKQRILGFARARGFLPPLPNRPVQPPHTMSWPSNPQHQMQPSQSRPTGPPPTLQMLRAMRGSGTSPDENGKSNEASASNGQTRKSPDQTFRMTPMIPGTPQGGIPGYPDGPSSGMMPRQGMVPFATMSMNNPSAMNMQGGPVGTPHMNNAMLSHQTLTPQMQQRIPPQYRQTMQALHKSGVAQAASPMAVHRPMPGANAASPATTSSSLHSCSPSQQQSPPAPGPFGMQGMAPNRMPPSAAGKAMGGPPMPGDRDGAGRPCEANQSPHITASAQAGHSAGDAPGSSVLGQNPPLPAPQSAPPQMQPQDMFGADMMGANFDTFGFDFQPDSFNGLGELGDMSGWFNDQGLITDKT
ncbi:hypothetical protein PsYK624_100230 [Phanerochaete sordida]|uniref:Uncharacterized protein n=1 Tax=Phanerochaete sordida TaxID=48140 RepID=A0A9P3GHS5_9APHY|nr:hypothetical protein PsYK624_100230 [Phanerochaete sordida]